MRRSRRARRMQRHHRRLAHKGGLNLTSLMDVFTILLVFLLVNISKPQTLPDSDQLTLPKSTAKASAGETTVVMVTRERILVNGDPVIPNKAALASPDATLPQLRRALVRAAPMVDTPKTGSKSQAGSKKDKPKGRGELTIMADKGLPYRLIRKVLVTSTATKFGRISLAVLQHGPR